MHGASPREIEVYRVLSDDCCKVDFPVGQRYINITRNEIGPKSGQKNCRKF